MKYTKKEISELNQDFLMKSPDELLRWALDELHPNIALATSFQSQGVVLIDMIMKIRTDARIFTLDTGRLNQETYNIIDQIRTKYDANIEVLFPDADEVHKMVSNYGVNLFYNGKENRILCCKVRKTNPLNKFLKNLDGWITSIRRDQTEMRGEIELLEFDELHGGILKVNPLAHWTSDQVWDYIRENSVPYNKLHDMGYPSIGCAPCTRPVKSGENPRAGRWWWESESDKECGIHYNYS